MLQAMLCQRVEFIELLIMNGFVMKSFVNPQRLRILYNEGVRIASFLATCCWSRTSVNTTVT